MYIPITDATIRFLENKADIHFIKTQQYDKARELLNDKNILILTGNPGEGKTAMAAHLALEGAQRKKTASNWSVLVIGKMSIGHFDVLPR